MQSTNPQGAKTKNKITKEKKKEVWAVSLLPAADVYHAALLGGVFWGFLQRSSVLEMFFLPLHCCQFSETALELLLSQTSCKDKYLNNLEISFNLR